MTFTVNQTCHVFGIDCFWWFLVKVNKIPTCSGEFVEVLVVRHEFNEGTVFKVKCSSACFVSREPRSSSQLTWGKPLLELRFDDFLNSIEKVNRNDPSSDWSIRNPLERMSSGEPPDIFDNSACSFARPVSANV